MAKQTFTTGQVLTAQEMTDLQKNDYNQTVSAKVASYTLVASDAGTRITMANASATSITVNTALFTAGDTLTITNISTGVCTITAGTATVSTSSTLALKQYDSGQLYFTSTGVAIFFSTDAADSTSPLTTKGDLYGFSTLDARIPIGTNNQVLTADSAQALGLKWASPAGGGKVLQVVSMNYTTETSFTNNTATATGITLAITPSLTSSKVLIFFSVNGVTHTAQNTLNGATIKLYRDASSIVQISAAGGRIGGTPVDLFETNFHHTYLDSPATTSATTYTVYVNNYYNGNALYINNAQAGTDSSSITLLEIGV